eukprot:scaffold30426_cov25-Prasinocladus_malaysianus.AAC.1
MASTSHGRAGSIHSILEDRASTSTDQQVCLSFSMRLLFLPSSIANPNMNEIYIRSWWRQAVGSLGAQQSRASQASKTLTRSTSDRSHRSGGTGSEASVDDTPFNWKLFTVVVIAASSGTLFGYDLGLIGTISNVPGFQARKRCPRKRSFETAQWHNRLRS